MDCQHHHRHSLFCILPPHMLESIAAAGDAKARKAALTTLSADTSLRTERIATQVVQAGLAAPLPSLLPHKQRLIHNANHGSSLPGARSEPRARPRSGMPRSTRPTTASVRRSISTGTSTSATRSTTQA